MLHNKNSSGSHYLSHHPVYIIPVNLCKGFLHHIHLRKLVVLSLLGMYLIIELSYKIFHQFHAFYQ